MEHPAVVDVRAVARAVLDCPAVMGLGGEVATFHRGRRIEGVRLRGEVLMVHVLGRYDVSIDALCAQVSAAVRPLVPGKRIDIAIVDMLEPYPVHPPTATTQPAGGDRRTEASDRGPVSTFSATASISRTDSHDHKERY